MFLFGYYVVQPSHTYLPYFTPDAAYNTSGATSTSGRGQPVRVTLGDLGGGAGGGRGIGIHIYTHTEEIITEIKGTLEGK